jgi:hypothetical protein
VSVIDCDVWNKQLTELMGGKKHEQREREEEKKFIINFISSNLHHRRRVKSIFNDFSSSFQRVPLNFSISSNNLLVFITFSLLIILLNEMR